MHDPTDKLITKDIGFIERQISEELILATEELLDQSALLKSNNINPTTWECTVTDKNIHYSIYIQIKNEKIVSTDCDCVNGRRGLQCPHILVALLSIRKHINHPKPQIKKIRKSRMDLKSFVNALDPKDLQSFALSYGRKHRGFRLMMQAQFVDQLDEDQTQLFFDATYPIHTKPNQNVSASNLSLFVAITRELQVHIKVHLNHGDYIRAYNLLNKSLNKFFYVKHHLTNTHKGFEESHQWFLKTYIECLNLVEAPEYKIYMKKELLSLLKSSFVDASHPLEQSLWIVALQDVEIKNSLREAAATFLQRNNTTSTAHYFVLMLSWMLDSASLWPSNIDQLDNHSVFRLSQVLSQYKDLQLAQNIIRTLLLNRDLNHTIAKMLLSCIAKPIDATLGIRLIEYYIRLRDIWYLHWLENHTDQWDQLRSRLKKKIEHTTDVSLMIEFFIYSSKPQQAAQVIEQTASFDLLMKYDAALLKLNPPICYQLYENMILRYLSDHFGHKAVDFMHSILARVTAIAGPQWSLQLSEQIKKAFPDRTGSLP